MHMYIINSIAFIRNFISFILPYLPSKCIHYKFFIDLRNHNQ